MDKESFENLVEEAHVKTGYPRSELRKFYKGIHDDLFRNLIPRNDLEIVIPKICHIKHTRKGKQILDMKFRDQGVGINRIHKRMY